MIGWSDVQHVFQFLVFAMMLVFALGGLFELLSELRYTPVHFSS